MHKVHSPRNGSLSYFPRKRCKDTVPRVKLSSVTTQELNGKGPSMILATKVGMCKIVSGGLTGAATILELPKVSVVCYTKYESVTGALVKKGLILEAQVQEMVSLKFVVSALMSFDFSETGNSRNKSVERQMFVLAPVDTDELKQEIISANSFNIRGISKGHGFTGIIKRFGIKLKKRKHARANKTRHIGAISTRGLARIPYTAPQAGQHGNHQRLEVNKENLTKDCDLTSATIFKHYGPVNGNLIAIRGSIVGCRKSLCMLRMIS
jgi:ribosomal protein L3